MSASGVGDNGGRVCLGLEDILKTVFHPTGAREIFPYLMACGDLPSRRERLVGKITGTTTEIFKYLTFGLIIGETLNSFY